MDAKPDLAFCDIFMPQNDGIEIVDVIATLRESSDRLILQKKGAADRRHHQAKSEICLWQSISSKLALTPIV
jgi:CheY-like chemotaxis protein